MVRDGDAIGALLTRMGAHDTVLAWEERRMRREVRATANRLANFDDANLRRSARAAVAAGARVERALEILGDDAPEHLPPPAGCGWSTGRLRWRSSASCADPPMTKDAVAGRIRRLLAMADKRAKELGIPDTESGVTADLARRRRDAARCSSRHHWRTDRIRCDRAPGDDDERTTVRSSSEVASEQSAPDDRVHRDVRRRQ